MSTCQPTDNMLTIQDCWLQFNSMWPAANKSFMSIIFWRLIDTPYIKLLQILRADSIEVENIVITVLSIMGLSYAFTHFPNSQSSSEDKTAALREEWPIHRECKWKVKMEPVANLLPCSVM